MPMTAAQKARLAVDVINFGSSMVGLGTDLDSLFGAEEQTEDPNAERFEELAMQLSEIQGELVSLRSDVLGELNGLQSTVQISSLIDNLKLSHGAVGELVNAPNITPDAWDNAIANAKAGLTGVIDDATLVLSQEPSVETMGAVLGTVVSAIEARIEVASALMSGQIAEGGLIRDHGGYRKAFFQDQIEQAINVLGDLKDELDAVADVRITQNLQIQWVAVDDGEFTVVPPATLLVFDLFGNDYPDEWEEFLTFSPNQIEADAALARGLDHGQLLHDALMQIFDANELLVNTDGGLGLRGGSSGSIPAAYQTPGTPTTIGISSGGGFDGSPSLFAFQSGVPAMIRQMMFEERLGGEEFNALLAGLEAISDGEQIVAPNSGDVREGGDGDDFVTGDSDDDILVGLGGSDYLNGKAGDDEMFGGAGGDVYFGDTGDDTIVDDVDDGEIDIARFAGLRSTYVFSYEGDTILVKRGDEVDRVTGIEALSFDDGPLSTGALSFTQQGGDGDDTLAGRQLDDEVYGGGGDDTLSGQAGDDRVEGGAGADMLYGGDGEDLVKGGGAADIVYGEAGDDNLYGGKGADRLFGGDGVDTFYGGADDDVIKGGDGDDVIYGGKGDDLLVGNKGEDLLDGGAGDDKLKGDEKADTLVDGDGKDILRGRGGDDVFRMDVDAYLDQIKDFQDGRDLVELTGAGFADLEIVDQGGGTVKVKYSGDKLLLSDDGVGTLSEADITAADFLFT